VDHPHRRLCGALARMKEFAAALASCERALELRPDSPYNKSGLASALAQRNVPGDLVRALPLARDAAAGSKDVILVGTWCMVSLGAHEQNDLRWCTESLMKIAPDSIEANYLGTLIAGDDGDWDLARSRLRKAKAAGLDEATATRLEADIARAEEQDAASSLPPAAWAAITIGLWVTGIWIAVMVILLVAGYALSRATLASANAATVATESEREGGLRRIYKSVLLLSGVYFYLSMPILLGITIAAGAGAIVMFWAMGTIPIKLVAIIGIVVIVTVGAILRSLFVRSNPPPPPGEELDLAKYPQLRALIDDVARTIGTRPAEVVYLTPGTDMAVTERAGLWSTLRHKATRRSLIMGVALFDDMTQLQLRSILAHEHGHFRNEDTAGGGFAIAVRRSLYTLIIRMAQSGVAGSFNPVWWFLRGFHRVYLGISQGASRLQEVLADRWAIQAYGSAAFIAGYEHVVARSVEFDHDVNATVKQVRSEQAVLANLYSFAAKTETSAVEADVKKAMAHEPSVYDSHPSPNQRIAWATQLAVTHAPGADDDAPVWALFPDREDLERAMTKVVRDDILTNYGIKLRATENDPVEKDDGRWSGYDDDEKTA
jgi:Zn-dependent protease with chaperone function